MATTIKRVGTIFLCSEWNEKSATNLMFFFQPTGQFRNHHAEVATRIKKVNKFLFILCGEKLEQIMHMCIIQNN